MSLQTCLACTCRCAASLTSCPHCGSEDLTSGETMPKTTRWEGASNAADLPAAEIPEDAATLLAGVATPAPVDDLVPDAAPEAEPDPEPEAAAPASPRRRTRR